MFNENASFESSYKGHQVQYYKWVPQEKPLCVLQIIHGMSEYIGRYDAFACWLREQGILVAGDDHIGHGTSADPSEYGYFGHTDGWKHLVDDEEKLRMILQKEYPDTPYVILGHSMGSFILRAWMAMYAKAADVDGVIVMGTCGTNKALPAGAAFTSLMMGLKGETKRSKAVNALAFSGYVKPFKDEKNVNAWLCRDKAVYEAYTEDPMAGFSFTLGGYLDLFALIRYISTDEWYSKVPKDLPILITSGACDPVGDFAKGPAEVYDRLEEAGCREVSLLLYEDMRHEILNEIGKEEVWREMRDFILDAAGVPAAEEFEEPEAEPKLESASGRAETAEN